MAIERTGAPPYALFIPFCRRWPSEEVWKARTTYTWHAIDDGSTRMTLRNRGEPAGFSKLAGSLMTAAMQRANRKDLSRLRQILEAA
jgi:hypothetical protein